MYGLLGFVEGFRAQEEVSAFREAARVLFSAVITIAILSQMC